MQVASSNSHPQLILFDIEQQVGAILNADETTIELP